MDTQLNRFHDTGPLPHINPAIKLHPQAHTIKCTDSDLIVELLDGRTISAPLVWFPRLSEATQKQLDN